MKDKDVLFPEITGDENSIIKESVTKEKIQQYIHEVKSLVDDGSMDALDMYMRAKIYSEMSSGTLKMLKDSAIEEARKYGNGENSMYGCKFEVSNGSTSYSFDHDDVWSELKSKIDALTKQLKEREDRMKSVLKAGGTLADDDGTIVPPAKVSGGTSESLRVSIPKS